MTTTAARWTVDEDGDLLYRHDGGYTMCIERQLPGRPSENRAQAIDALVQCVRDADTLRQARDFIRSCAGGIDSGVEAVRELLAIICDTAEPG